MSHSAAASMTNLHTTLAVPTIEFPEHAMGGTGYIDNMKVEDLGDSNVVKGVDIHGRRFISFKIQDGDRTRVETAFQRYSNTNDVWTSGGSVGFTTGAFRDEDVERFNDLLAGKIVGVPSYAEDRPVSLASVSLEGEDETAWEVVGTALGLAIGEMVGEMLVGTIESAFSKKKK
jgi:hypothetical protein